MKVNLDIPISLLTRIDSLNLSKKMNHHLMCLISSFIYALEDGTEDIFSFYKPLHTDYIKQLTSETFYKKIFPLLRYNYLNTISNNSPESDSLFQTDGSYKTGVYPMHYRLNPDCMAGDTRSVTIDLNLPDFSLNDTFKDIIAYYDWSFLHLSVDESFHLALSEELSIGQSGSSADDDCVFIARSYAEGVKLMNIKPPNLFVDKVIVFGAARIIGKHFSYVRKMLQGIRSEKTEEDPTLNPSYIKIILDGDRVLIDHIYDYMSRREDRARRSALNKVNKIINGIPQRVVSATNGRFSTNLTSLPSFLIKYMRLNGENLTSLDLKSSQLLILLNLMVGSENLFSSLKNSGFPQLRNYVQTFQMVNNESYDIRDFLELCLAGDIYEQIASTSGVTRDMAKPIFLKLLYTEPGFGISRKFDITQSYPDFFEYLKQLKVAFHNEYGSSKRSLSLFLQMVESHIFIEKIYSEMSKQRNYPAFTKHDSVLISGNAEQIAEVNAIIDGVFKSLDFRGKIVSESYFSFKAGNIDLNHPSMNLAFMYPELYKDSQF